MSTSHKAKPFAVADCETDPFKAGRIPEPFLWGYYDGTEYQQFEKTDDFVNFVREKRSVVYFHNGGKFDLHYLLPYLQDDSKLQLISGRIAHFDLGHAELRDSYLLLPTPLAAFNKTDIDYRKFEADVRAKHMEEIAAYLKDDCVFLYDYLAAFFQTYPRKATIASTALQVWRGMRGRVDKTTARFYDRFAPYYYGGRVECFSKGVINEPIKVFDIKSAYPTAMLRPHPAGSQYNTTTTIVEKLLPRSFVDLTAESDGALPHRNEDGSISFPVGSGRFQVSGHEVLTGLETGTVRPIRVHSVRIFKESIDFSDYIHHFYELKLAAEHSGNKAERWFAKIFLNSLYGKMAANPAKYRDYLIAAFGTARDGWDLDTILQDGRQLISRQIPESQRRYYNLATGASITGWVRAYLWKHIYRVGHVHYCDTDSLMCGPKAKVWNMRQGEELGDWEQEASGDRLAVAGKKMYGLFDGDRCVKKACKGVNLTGEQILRVAQGEIVTNEPEVPTYSVKRGIGFTEREVRMT